MLFCVAPRVGVRDSQSTLQCGPFELGLGIHNPRLFATPLELGLGTHNPRFFAWPLELGLETQNPPLPGGLRPTSTMGGGVAYRSEEMSPSVSAWCLQTKAARSFFRRSEQVSM